MRYDFYLELHVGRACQMPGVFSCSGHHRALSSPTSLPADPRVPPPAPAFAQTWLLLSEHHVCRGRRKGRCDFLLERKPSCLSLMASSATKRAKLRQNTPREGHTHLVCGERPTSRHTSTRQNQREPQRNQRFCPGEGDPRSLIFFWVPIPKDI